MHFNSFLFLSFISLNFQINQSKLDQSIREKRDKWNEKEINQSYNQQSQIRVSWQSINQMNEWTNQLMLFWFYFHQSFTIDSWFHLTSNNQSLIKCEWVKEKERKSEIWKSSPNQSESINQSQINQKSIK